jgi:hypothetical protein
MKCVLPVAHRCGETATLRDWTFAGPVHVEVALSKIAGEAGEKHWGDDARAHIRAR